MNEKALAKIADYVVYGHTHKPETVFLTSTADTEKIYFNSGTWRRVHAPCIKNPKAEFANFHVMTYIIFYTDGERKGRRYETWNGQLG
jgi:UDP-2,3-diacylglucosamine pyrophosphatase LpxH